MSDVLTHEECENLSEEEKLKLIDKVLDDYERDESNLIQILHMVQAIYGFLPIEIIRHIAKGMDMPISKISGVVTFYSFFSKKPKGKYCIQVCLGTACYVRGGKKIIEKLEEILGISVGDTTEDRMFSLEVMRCIGACGLAPAIMINGEVYKQVNPNKLHAIIGAYE